VGLLIGRVPAAPSRASNRPALADSRAARSREGKAGHACQASAAEVRTHAPNLIGRAGEVNAWAAASRALAVRRAQSVAAAQRRVAGSALPEGQPITLAVVGQRLVGRGELLGHHGCGGGEVAGSGGDADTGTPPATRRAGGVDLDRDDGRVGLGATRARRHGGNSSEALPQEL